MCDEDSDLSITPPLDNGYLGDIPEEDEVTRPLVAKLTLLLISTMFSSCINTD